MNLQRIELMGKPHIGAVSYASPTSTSKLNRDPYEVCQICGQPATNTHHIVPKGMGGGNSWYTHNGVRMRSPLIAVCGTDNVSGCHGLFHQNHIHVRWVWRDQRFKEAYENCFEVVPHSQEFWRLGYYAITSPFWEGVRIYDGIG